MSVTYMVSRTRLVGKRRSQKNAAELFRGKTKNVANSKYEGIKFRASFLRELAMRRDKEKKTAENKEENNLLGLGLI